MSGISATVASMFTIFGSLTFIAVAVVYVLIEIVGMWKVFTKAGQPGWGAIIPIYNAYLLCKIAGRPAWWCIFSVLSVIPLVGLVWFVMYVIICLDIATAFGKGSGFGIGLAFLGFVFFPILGFGSATYYRPRMGMGATLYAAPPYPLDPQYGQQTWQPYGQQPPAHGQPYPGGAPTGTPWVAPSSPPPWATQSAPPAPAATPPAPQQAPVSASPPPAPPAQAPPSPQPAPPAQAAPPAPQTGPPADAPTQAPAQSVPAQQAPPVAGATDTTRSGLTCVS
jgi:hypothetical protein